MTRSPKIVLVPALLCPRLRISKALNPELPKSETTISAAKESLQQMPIRSLFILAKYYTLCIVCIMSIFCITYCLSCSFKPQTLAQKLPERRDWPTTGHRRMPVATHTHRPGRQGFWALAGYRFNIFVIKKNIIRMKNVHFLNIAPTENQVSVSRRWRFRVRGMTGWSLRVSVLGV